MEIGVVIYQVNKYEIASEAEGMSKYSDINNVISGLIMPKKPRISFASVAEHVIQRGNNWQAIFPVKMT